MGDILLLSGCSSNTVSTTPRQEFVAKNGTNKNITIDTSSEVRLSPAEAEKLADEIESVTTHSDTDWNNDILRKVLYEHYAANPVRRPDMEESKKSRQKYPVFLTPVALSPTIYINARTDLGTSQSTKYNVEIYENKTKINLPLLDPKDGIGTMLIHEMFHYYHSNVVSKGMDSDKKEEAKAYGIEYFFVRHRARGKRAKEIIEGACPEEWLSANTWETLCSKGYNFCKYYLMLKWCYDGMKIHKEFSHKQLEELSVAIVKSKGNNLNVHAEGWAKEFLLTKFGCSEDSAFSDAWVQKLTQEEKNLYSALTKFDDRKKFISLYIGKNIAL